MFTFKESLSFNEFNKLISIMEKIPLHNLFHNLNAFY
jgi:hypothetical protein